MHYFKLSLIKDSWGHYQGRIQDFGKGGPVDRVAVVRGRSPSSARGGGGGGGGGGGSSRVSENENI